MTTEKKEALITSIGFGAVNPAMECIRFIQCAQAGSASQFHDASSTHFCWNMRRDSRADPFVWTTT